MGVLCVGVLVCWQVLLRMQCVGWYAEVNPVERAEQLRRRGFYLVGRFLRITVWSWRARRVRLLLSV